MKHLLILTCIFHLGSSFTWTYYYNPFFQNRNTLLRRNFYAAAPPQWSQTQLQNSDLTTPDRCNLPAESGRCLGYLRMFHYDPADDTCKQFTYGGCDGNENRFRTRRECELACKKGPSDVQQVGQFGQEGADLTDDGKCTLPPESGRCLAAFKRYFYDPADEQCKLFTFGGCEGNANKYRTKEECEQTCKPHSQQTFQEVQQGVIPPIAQFEQAEGDICTLQPDPGTCYGSFEKFYYDAASRQCRTFIYGGCRGNRNNFQSLEECQEICGYSQPSPAVQYPPESSYPQAGTPYQPGVPITSPPFTFQQPVGPDLTSPVAGGAQRVCDVSQCPWNLWAHYTERECQPVYQEGECCPTRFECPKTDIGRQTNECVYKNRLYPIGADVNVSDPCQVCVCQGFPGEAGKINCASVECPEGFMPPPQGCYSVYEENQCCAVTRACSESVNIRDEQNVCNYGGKSYHYGQKIYFDEDPCMECICSQNFRGPGGPGCTKIQCHMELKEETFRLGCVPIYHKNVCCPIDWRCPQQGEIQQSVGSIQTDQQGTDICILRPERGPCRSTKPRFYYDADLGRCQTFIYGGCQGNENNFQSLSECEQRCANRNQEPEVDLCTLPPEKGPCKASRTRFFFDSRDGTCKNFVYGGCQGNANNFATREQCLAQCGHRAAGRDEEICLLSADAGPCRADKPKYYYDAQSQQCKQFMYGGCQGNANNFHSLAECQQRCSGVSAFKQETPSTIDPICYLEPEHGSCKAARNRFYYDAEAADCRNFTYGGCQGNENNFLTYQTCYARCVLPSQRVETLEPVCDFGGKTYPIGHSLATEDPCVECTCKTPPMLTCVHQACPSIPNDDYENCTPNFQPGKCCPEYVCTTPSISITSEQPSSSLEEHLCKDFPCVEGQICKLEDEHCLPQKCRPKCVSEVEVDIIQTVQKVVEKVPCPIPSCPGHCKVGEIPSMRCPTCICAKTKEEACTDFECPSGYQCDVDEEKCSEGDCTPLCKRKPSILETGLETDLCSLPADKGPCKKAQTRFYYDANSKRCRTFLYGGCQGNANNFETKEKCLKKCDTKSESEVVVSSDEMCNLPKDSGNNCDDRQNRQLRYYYNSTFGYCSIFLHKGCGGNANQFASRADCEKACYKKPVIPPSSANRRLVTTPKPRIREDCKNCDCSIDIVKCRGCCRNRQETDIGDVCSLPKEPGHCVIPQPTSLRYYYNKELDYCGVFVYTGCGGNANQFDSRNDCEAKCMMETTTASRVLDVTEKSISEAEEVEFVSIPPPPPLPEEPQTDVCSLPPEKGPCRSRKIRFHFDPSDSTCKTFFYGGCLGNQNNFQTKEECLEKCSQSIIKTDNRCSLPKLRGECYDGRRGSMKYYYDSNRKECSVFLYSGCHGNENRFDTVTECERTCLRVSTETSFPPRRDTEHVTTNLEEICKRMHCPRGYTCVINKECQENCRPQCKRTTEIATPDQSIDEPSVHDRCPRIRCNSPCKTILTMGGCAVCDCETYKTEVCKKFFCPPGTTCDVEATSCKGDRCLPICRRNDELHSHNTQENEAEMCKDIVCPEGTECILDQASCRRGRCEPMCSDSFNEQIFEQSQNVQQQSGY